MSSKHLDKPIQSYQKLTLGIQLAELAT